MSKKFAQFANYVAEVSGQPGVFGAAAVTVVLWLVTGPIFAYSDTWQLVMNSWTNVVTFLMVFVIQNSQNRDSSALQAKIDELIRASGREIPSWGSSSLRLRKSMRFASEPSRRHRKCRERKFHEWDVQ
jgi:low affinity Fe/Cu permease